MNTLADIEGGKVITAKEMEQVLDDLTSLDLRKMMRIQNKINYTIEFYNFTKIKNKIEDFLLTEILVSGQKIKGGRKYGKITVRFNNRGHVEEFEPKVFCKFMLILIVCSIILDIILKLINKQSIKPLEILDLRKNKVLDILLDVTGTKHTIALIKMLFRSLLFILRIQDPITARDITESVVYDPIPIDMDIADVHPVRRIEEINDPSVELRNKERRLAQLHRNVEELESENTLLKNRLFNKSKIQENIDEISELDEFIRQIRREIETLEFPIEAIIMPPSEQLNDVEVIPFESRNNIISDNFGKMLWVFFDIFTQIRRNYNIFKNADNNNEIYYAGSKKQTKRIMHKKRSQRKTAIKKTVLKSKTNT